MAIPLSVVAFTLLPINTQTSTSWEVRSAINSFSYTDNNAIYDFVKGKESNYKKGEQAFTLNEVSLSSQYKHFSVSIVKRYEWFLKYSKDTMELYGTTVNGELIDADRNYDLSLDVFHLSAEGIRFAYLQPFHNFNFYVAGSYLNAQELIEGSVRGDASLTGSCGDGFECYTGDLDIDYTYSEDALFDRKVSATSSIYGYSVDVGFDWNISDKLFASVYIQDLLSEILWDNTPYTTATATTSTTKVEDGKYKIDPVITGYEGNANYKQTLPTKYNALVNYQFNAHHSSYVQGFHSYGATLFNIGYRFQNKGVIYGLKVYPIETVLGVEFKSQYVDIGLSSKPFDHENSEILAFNIGLNFPF